MPDTTPFAQRRARFRQLHQSGCFVLPNPWDIGTARYLAEAGFPALATTSSGYAFSRGRPDGGIGCDEMLAHIAELVGATDLPVNADFENGHAADLDGLAANVRRCVETGVAGLSIEDSTGLRNQPLFDFDEAVRRVRTARQAIDATGADVMLVARAECWLAGHPEPLKEALKRLAAYAAEGADCLYAPGVRRPEEIAALVKEVAPLPLNLLFSAPGALRVAQIADLGVRRISLGGALSRAAWGGFGRAVAGLKDGNFEGLAGAMPHADLQGLFSRP